MVYCVFVYYVFVITSHIKLHVHVQFVVADSRRQIEQWQNGPQSEINPNLAIPLLMQNKVPDGFEDGDHVKVDLRPESVSMDTDCVTEMLSNLKHMCTIEICELVATLAGI